MELLDRKLTVAELRGFDLFSQDPDEALAWIAERLQLVRYDAGETVIRQGDPIGYFSFIVDGAMQFIRENDPYSEPFLGETGDAVGLLPFSRMKVSRGRGTTLRETIAATMEAEHLRDLVYRAPCLAQKLVSEMVDRTREATRSEERSSKMLALGKLAAGLAHELNNPAGAALRSAARLREVMARRLEIEEHLVGHLPPDQWLPVIEIGASLEPVRIELDPLERDDRESEILDWLADRSLPAEFSGDLVDSGLTLEQLDRLPRAYASDILQIILLQSQMLQLSVEMEEAAKRIAELIQAVKTYTYMDQLPVTEVDVPAGIDTTLRIFQHQLKKGVEVIREYDPGLPRILANGSELNQVWTNLIDNALDALCEAKLEQPQLRIRVCREPEALLVEISDNGPGVPPEIQGRIFEPFFTTKPVGEGTGLGLDIVHRIIRRHKGSIRLDSEPGRTTFQVRLALDGAVDVAAAPISPAA